MAVSNPGASPWQVTTPSRRAVRHQVESQTRQRLQQEAASLLPDTTQLSEVLLKHDLSPVDRAQSTNTLNTKLDDYLRKYKENPYFVFSREGTEGIKELRRMVNSPGIIAASQAYLEDKEVKKRFDAANLSGHYNVNSDGQVQVLDRETGALVFKTPDSIDFKRYVPGTLDDFYRVRNNSTGYYNEDPSEIRANNFEMEDPDKVRTQIQSYFSDLGSDKRQSIGNELLSTITDSNAAQVRYRLNALMSDMGLSPAAKNTLYAQFYKEQAAKGQKMSKQAADQAFNKYIADIAGGKLSQDVTYKENPALAATKTAGEIKGAVGTTPSEHQILHGPRIPYTFGDGNKTVSATVTPLDKATLNKSSSYYVGDDKQKYPRLNMVEANPMRFVSPEQVYIADLNNPGKLVAVPPGFERLMGGIVLDNQVFNATATQIGQNNSRYLLEPGQPEDPNSQEQDVMFKGYFQPGHATKEAEAFEAFLESLGYTPQGANDAGLDMDYYQKNVADTYSTDLGILPDFLNFQDKGNLYGFQLLTPATSDLVRAIEGGAPSQRSKEEYNQHGAGQTSVFDTTNGLLNLNPFGNTNGKAKDYPTLDEF